MGTRLESARDAPPEDHFVRGPPRPPGDGGGAAARGCGHRCTASPSQDPEGHGSFDHARGRRLRRMGVRGTRRSRRAPGPRGHGRSPRHRSSECAGVTHRSLRREGGGAHASPLGPRPGTDDAPPRGEEEVALGALRRPRGPGNLLQPAGKERRVERHGRDEEGVRGDRRTVRRARRSVGDLPGRVALGSRSEKVSRSETGAVRGR